MNYVTLSMEANFNHVFRLQSSSCRHLTKMPKVATSPRRIRFAPFPRVTPDAIDEILQSLEESPRSKTPRRGSVESNGANPICAADRYPRTPVAHLFINNKTVMSSSKDWKTVLDPVSNAITTTLSES